MSDTVIRVESVGKKYVLRHQEDLKNRKTLRDLITDRSKALLQTVNPLARNSIHKSQISREEFWALKDVSFEIKQGSRVGIIGRNGAGKSTLLKILSRIMEPTEGRIRIKGRVSSLLEVGTGFHPELTGRENIYLNGTILGMGKAEITKKFDEIVNFAEVEKFLDTPVKRYSSGMYVRLAFAVAAHLEPEILIVDEVLAVGDIQFQKKCLGKIQDISESEGRTVIFVSHNVDAIQRLCSQCVMLERGQLIAYGNTTDIIVRYVSSNSRRALPNEWIDLSNVSRAGTGEARFVAVHFSSLNEAFLFQPYADGPLEFSLAIESDSFRTVSSLAVTLYDQAGVKLVDANTGSIGRVISLQKSYNVVRIRIEQLHLNPGIYLLGFWLDSRGINEEGSKTLDYIESAFEIEVLSSAAENFGVEVDGAVTCQFKVLDAN